MLLTLPLCLFLFASVPVKQESAAVRDIIPRDYLTLGAVDARGRRPFRPDAVFLEHLWRPGSPPPSEGLELRGEKGEAQRWTRAEASPEGGLGGSIGYAYCSFDSPVERVMLARLSGASTLFLNGRAFTGDVYGFGFGGVPVVVAAGRNQVFVSGVRGGFELRFLDVQEEGVLHGGWDDTLPQLVVGEPPRGYVGLELANASRYPSGPLQLRYGGGLFAEHSFVVDGLPALGVLQLALPLTGGTLAEDVEGPLSLPVHVSTRARIEGEEALDGFLSSSWIKRAGDPNAHEARALDFELKLELRQPGQKLQRTYLSDVDGSIQKYSLVPPAAAPEPPAWMGLVLSLHGAGVEAWGQAACYEQRPDFWLVAPTNRRKFGFDWQDWGRRDAQDVLALALGESAVDARHVFVSGHSMGGHGTWHLAANDLDRFAACAPSAGWCSFDTYGGRPEGARRALWQAADASSLTLELISNLKQLPVYVLHGTADDNVPAREALDMLTQLSEAGGSFDAHFEGGAGHWWGNRCVDWPGIFDSFRGRSIPVQPARLQFKSAGPEVDADHHWLHVEQVLRSGEFFEVAASFDADAQRVSLSTTNVGWMSVARPLRELVVDEQSLELGELDPRDACTWLRREGDQWRLADGPPPSTQKSAGCSGPFKRAFDRHFVLVVGTSGSAQESAELLARAQQDAGTWRYRGNGRAPIVTDQNFLGGATLSCNLILYGNRDTNAAWSAALGEDCPIDARRGRIELRSAQRTLVREGEESSCVFVYPRLDEPGSLVGVFADSGLAGTRLGLLLAPFVSGVGYPDFALFDGEVLSGGDAGVRAAGWFDQSWRIAELGD